MPKLFVIFDMDLHEVENITVSVREDGHTHDITLHELILEHTNKLLISQVRPIIDPIISTLEQHEHKKFGFSCGCNSCRQIFDDYEGQDTEEETIFDDEVGDDSILF